MNLYQLEYAFESKWAGITKRRSYFYRPECIMNRELWQEIRVGNEVLTIGDELEAGKFASADEKQ